MTYTHPKRGDSLWAGSSAQRPLASKTESRPRLALNHSRGNSGSGVAVVSRPPSGPKARKNKTSAWRPKPLAQALFFLSLASASLWAEQIVYPQAAVGPLGADTFVIDLSIGNLSREETVEVRIRLLDAKTLAGMNEIRFQDDSGSQSVQAGGAQTVALAPLESVRYQISSETLQIGVLVIDTPDQSDFENLSTSFFYKLLDSQGTISDLIAVLGVKESSSAFRGLIATQGTFNVGVALVPARNLDDPSAAATVDLIATLPDGSERRGQIVLGGAEPHQKAFFPNQSISGLPQDIPVAQLRIEADERLFAAVLAVVSPPDSVNVQIGSAPLDSLNLVPTGDFQLDTQNRQAGEDLYNAVKQASRGVDPRWTGDYSQCQAGSVAGPYRDAVLRLINFVRVLAGVPANVTLDPTFNRDAQASALISGAEGTLSHTPDNSFACFSDEGANGSLRSNISLHLDADPTLVVGGYMRDPGASNTSVGHRRWLLQPGQENMGVGVTFDRFRSPFPGASAIYVVGPRSSLRRQVAWPPAGFVPSELVYERWSFSSPEADFSAATVAMTSGGLPLTLDIVDSGAGDQTSTGRAPFIVWEPDIVQTPTDGAKFRITIEFSVNGQPSQVSYEVTIIGP